jgi:hypothetical protein
MKFQELTVKYGYFSSSTLVLLRIFLLRSAPAGNHQLVEEDLKEAGTISRISNA